MFIRLSKKQAQQMFETAIKTFHYNSHERTTTIPKILKIINLLKENSNIFLDNVELELLTHETDPIRENDLIIYKNFNCKNKSEKEGRVCHAGSSLEFESIHRKFDKIIINSYEMDKVQWNEEEGVYYYIK